MIHPWGAARTCTVGVDGVWGVLWLRHELPSWCLPGPPAGGSVTRS